jgi:AcrR family transcriptional regulator
MSPSSTSQSKTDRASALEPARLARADRREALLDAALSLVAVGDLDSVSIESVADRAGVSRPLVYKHFANRTEILTALYLREAERLHQDLSVDVQAAASIEDKYRALFHGSIRAAKDRGQIFAGLRSAADMNGRLRKIQRDRDRSTVEFYAKHTVEELDVPQQETEAVTSMLLGAIAPALSLWHARPNADYARQLEEAYMCLVSGALAELTQRTRRRVPRLGIRSRPARAR